MDSSACDNPLALMRMEQELQKFNDILVIFRKLKESGCISALYSAVQKIFQMEHEFIIQELSRMQQQCQVEDSDLNFSEHYRLNAHIFKSNLQQIVSIMIDDFWLQFTSQAISSQQAHLQNNQSFNKPPSADTQPQTQELADNQQ